MQILSFNHITYFLSGDWLELAIRLLQGAAQGFDIGENNLLWNLMDMTQIFFPRKDTHDNFEVFINESVSSKANTEVLKYAILSNTAEF